MVSSGLVLAFVVLISAISVFSIMRSPDAPGRSALLFSGISVLWWITTVLLRLNLDILMLEEKVRLCELAWFGIVGTPLFWSIGFLNYAGYVSAGRNRYLTVALAISLFSGFAALTNDYHHMIYTGITNTERPSFSHGWLYFAILGLIYATLLVACIAALLKLRRSSGLHRLQFVGAITAMALPWAANLSFNLFEFRILDDDPTPFAFALTSIIMLAIQRYAKLFTAPPVARDVIFTILPDPVIVLDRDNTILEVNPAAEKLAELGSRPVGRQLPHGHPLTTLPANAFKDPESTVLIHLHQETRVFEVSQRNLDQWNRKSCRLLVLREVTERETAKKKLEATGRDLQARLEENLRLQERLQEEATHDHLTGLHNRRYANSAAANLIQHATSQNQTAIIIFDLDHFKQINDQFGHDVGDDVLVAFADLLKESLGPSELAFRYGGEEFLMVLPRSSEDAARQRSAELRSKFANANIAGLLNFMPKFSAGIATAPKAGTTLSDCVKAADIALYRAKISGRNQDVMWGDHLKGMSNVSHRHDSDTTGRVA